MAPEPVVLLGHVGEGPLAGELERRHPDGLIGLQIALFGLGAGGSHGERTVQSRTMPAAADATAERIRDVNTRYHDLAADSYDAKWGIDFAETGQAQVRAKLTKALGAEPGRWEHALEIGAGTGYFSLNLMTAGTIGRLTATDIAPGMLRALEANAAELGPRGRDRRHRRRAPPLPRRELRPRARPRRPAPHPRPRPRGGRVPAGAEARGHGRVLRRAVGLRRPDRGPAEARGDRRGPDLAACRRRRQARLGRRLRSRLRARPRGRGRRPRLRAAADPADLQRRRLRRRPDPRRGAAGEPLRLVAADGRVDRRARRDPAIAGASSPSAAT